MYLSICIAITRKQGRIHGYLSRVRVGRGGEKKQSVTDRQTDGQTDRAGCRVACTRLKIMIHFTAKVALCLGVALKT